MKITVLSFVLMGLLVSIAYSSFTYMVNRHCYHLERIAHDENLVAELWEQIRAIFDDPSGLKTAGRFATVGEKAIFSARIDARDVPGNLGIDWEALEIPLDHATFQVVGEGMDNNNFGIGLVDEIRVGFGYRFFLSFEIRNEKNSGESAEQVSSQLAYDLSVGCLN